MKPPSRRQREIAERHLRLRQKIERAQPGAGLAGGNIDFRAELALVFGRQRSIGPQANLPGQDQQVSRNRERHIIGHRRCRPWQHKPLFDEFPRDFSSFHHGQSPPLRALLLDPRAGVAQAPWRQGGGGIALRRNAAIRHSSYPPVEILRGCP